MLLVLCRAVISKPTEIGSLDFNVGGRPNQEMTRRVPDQPEWQIRNLENPERRFIHQSGGQMNPGRLESFDKGEPIPVTKPRASISHLIRTRSDPPTEAKSGQRLEELSRILEEPWKDSKPQQETPSSVERPRKKRSYRHRPYYNNYYGDRGYGPYYGNPYMYDDYDYDVVDFEIFGSF